MKFQYRLDGTIAILFCFSISNYSFAKYDTFSDDLVFDTQIKSQWTADQLIQLGNYCNELFKLGEQEKLKKGSI